MTVRDIGRKVEDDYSNIEILKNSSLISSELAASEEMQWIEVIQERPDIDVAVITRSRDRASTPQGSSLSYSEL